MVTDFNLMCKAGASGTLKHINGSAGSTIRCQLQANFELIYLYSGKANYDVNDLEAGDCLVIEQGSQIEIACAEDCDFVQTSIDLID